ncbi:unnamed protein product, partial [Brenthis ino]
MVTSLNIIKQRRSWVWSYFKRVTSTLAQCTLCNRNICHGGNATGNMNRHLKMIHNKTAETVEDKFWAIHQIVRHFHTDEEYEATFLLWGSFVL